MVFEDSRKRFLKGHQENVADLRDRYAERLETVKTVFRDRGDLGKVLEVEAQQEAARTGGDLPSVNMENESELAVVRRQYDAGLKQLEEELAAKDRGLQGMYLEHLKVMKAKLTRENRIEEALAIRDEELKVEAALRPVEAEGVESRVTDENRFRLLWGMPQRARQVLVLHEGLQRKPNLVFDRLSKFEHEGLLLRGGRVEIEGMDEALVKAVHSTGEWSLIADFQTADLDQDGPARILTYSKNDQERNFTLGQQGDRLMLRLRTSESDHNGTNPELDLGKLQAGVRTKVVFSYGPRGVVFARDGKAQVLGDISGELSNWEKMPLLIGNEAGNSDRDWRGQIFAFGLSNEAVRVEDAEKLSAPD